ncbi:MAG: hypothetical protein JSR76_04305 [Verrucomicrobia bacterium]|nr:hypothetical protein [Verrucomicrobiota bacterium]
MTYDPTVDPQFEGPAGIHDPKFQWSGHIWDLQQNPMLLLMEAYVKGIEGEIGIESSNAKVAQECAMAASSAIEEANNALANCADQIHTCGYTGSDALAGFQVLQVKASTQAQNYQSVTQAQTTSISNESDDTGKLVTATRDVNNIQDSVLNNISVWGG